VTSALCKEKLCLLVLSVLCFKYILGRYNKYSRELSQTPWICDGKRKSESSVEEEICNLMKDVFRYEGTF